MNPNELIELIEKKNKNTLLDSVINFFDKEHISNKNQEIADLYDKAANLYRIEKKYFEAGEAYKMAGSYYMKADNSLEATGSLNNAINCFHQIDIYTTICCYYEIIRIYTLTHNFDKIAEYSFRLAEIYEKEGIIDRAIEYYQNVVTECETLPNRSSLHNKSLIKLAELYIRQKKFHQAGDIYEKYAYSILNNRLLQYSAKEYYFNAGFCRLASGDIVAFRKFLDKYIQEWSPFQNTFQCTFLMEMRRCLENMDKDAIQLLIKEYKNLYPLEEWKNNILIQITDNNIDLL